MRSQISRSARSFVSAASRHSSRSFSGGSAAAVVSGRRRLASLTSFGASESGSARRVWISAAVLALPAAAFMLQEQEALDAPMERTLIAINPHGKQRNLIREIIPRFERKGYKLVGIKAVVPPKFFPKEHYDYQPVIAMVWGGQGVIKNARKLIGAPNPHKPPAMVWEGEVFKYVRELIGVITRDLAVLVGRHVLHASDGPLNAKEDINLWFEPEELVNYASNYQKLFFSHVA